MQTAGMLSLRGTGENISWLSLHLAVFLILYIVKTGCQKISWWL